MSATADAAEASPPPDDASAMGELHIATVSHELRSPVHAIAGLAELLLDRDLREEDRRLVAAIHRESEALETLLNDLLVLSKMQAGKLKVVVDSFSPRAIVDEVLSMYAELAATKGLTLQARIADDLPLAFRGDRVRIRQVLINLASNAVKYTESGSVTITATSAGLEASTADLASDSPTHNLRFEVADTGPGIPAEALPRLFEAFEHVRDEDRQVGTGLGLVITRQLVDLLAGTIEVETSPQGSSFAVSLPMRRAERRTDLVAATQTQSTGRVLVVDDSEVNRLLASSQLLRLGLDAEVAESGDDALELIKTMAFDLVLMDWHMPGMDGLAATRAINQLPHPPTAPPPIIIVTADVSEGARRTCLESGAADYLPKPVSLASLSACLTKWTAMSADEDLATEPDIQPVEDRAVQRAVLDALVADLGSAPVVAGVVATFAADAPRRLAAMQSSDDATTLADRARAAHTLKSTAALLGATRLAEQCAAAESTYRDNGALTATDHAALTSSLDASIAELTAFCASLESPQGDPS